MVLGDLDSLLLGVEILINVRSPWKVSLLLGNEDRQSCVDDLG